MKSSLRGCRACRNRPVLRLDEADNLQLTFAADEQWGVQCMGLVATKADIWVKSSMSRELTEKAHMRYCSDVGETVSALVDDFRRRTGENPSVAVFPYGQLTVPQLAL